MEKLFQFCPLYSTPYRQEIYSLITSFHCCKVVIGNEIRKEDGIPHSQNGLCVLHPGELILVPLSQRLQQAESALQSVSGLLSAALIPRHCFREQQDTIQPHLQLHWQALQLRGDGGRGEGEGRGGGGRGEGGMREGEGRGRGTCDVLC